MSATYLVTGASGNVGGEVAAALLAAGEQVRALHRGDPAVLPAGVQPVPGDLNQPESLGPALSDVDGVFLLPGFDAAAGVLAAAGVRRVVLLSGGSAGDGDRDNAISAYMAASEAAVRESGVAWTLLRPSAFMSNALRWADELRAGDVVREPFPDTVAANVDPYDIAAVAVAALRTPDHEGRVLRLSGPEPLLPADRLRILGEVLGRSLTLHGLTPEQARAELAASTPPRYVDAFFRFYVDGTLDESPVLPTVAEVTGRAPRTFREWAQRHAGAFG